MKPSQLLSSTIAACDNLTNIASGKINKHINALSQSAHNFADNIVSGTYGVAGSMNTAVNGLRDSVLTATDATAGSIEGAIGGFAGAINQKTRRTRAALRMAQSTVARNADRIDTGVQVAGMTAGVMAGLYGVHGLMDDD